MSKRPTFNPVNRQILRLEPFLILVITSTEVPIQPPIYLGVDNIMGLFRFVMHFGVNEKIIRKNLTRWLKVEKETKESLQIFLQRCETTWTLLLVKWRRWPETTYVFGFRYLMNECVERDFIIMLTDNYTK